MPAEIARANIEHFKKLLETETDAKKRDVIQRLLVEEEQKLAALKHRTERKKDWRNHPTRASALDAR
jgi:hypothetical protein